MGERTLAEKIRGWPEHGGWWFPALTDAERKEAADTIARLTAALAEAGKERDFYRKRADEWEAMSVGPCECGMSRVKNGPGGTWRCLNCGKTFNGLTALTARITELEGAVNVLGAECRMWRDIEEGAGTTCSGACDDTNANPIASAALAGKDKTK